MTTARGPALLERDREVAALAAAAADAVAGTARLVVVEGPAGIGKSRLLAALRAEAPGLGLRVLAARGGELEAEFPFGVVRQLWEPPLADPATRERWLAGPAAPAAPVLAAPGGSGGAPGDASFAALHGLFWLTATAAAESPLAVVVDDLHWVDVPSLRHLAYLVRRLEGLPVLLVAGLRSGERGADAGLVAEIAGDPAALVLRPAPFGDEAVEALITGRLGPPEPEFLEACRETTGGNPLLLEQTLRSLADDGVTPDAAGAGRVREVGARAISRTVLLRLARLPADAASVARAISALGEGADLPGIAALAGLDEARAAGAVAALARAEIVRPEPPVGFVHPLVREAVYHDADPATRELLHAAAARHLATVGAPPERVAAQLMLVSPRRDAGVVRTLREAAAAASARGAPETATTLLHRALDEPPDPGERTDLLLQLGSVESQVDLRAGVGRLREAWDDLDEARRVAVSRQFAWGLIFRGDAQEGADLARSTAGALPPAQEDLRRWLLGVAAAAVNFGAIVPEAPGYLRDARRARGVGPGARALQSWASFDWCLKGGAAAEVAPLAADALADGTLLAEPDGFMLGCAALLALEMAEAPEADAAWDASLAQAHRGGSLFAISAILLWRGLGLLWRGDLREARSHLLEAAPMLSRWGLASDVHALSFLTEVEAAAGDPAAAPPLPEESGWPGHADGSLFRLRAQTVALLVQGDHAAALGTADALHRGLVSRGTAEVMNPAWIPWRSLRGRALAGLGRVAEARPLIEAELARARAWGAPRPVGHALRLLGELEGGGGLELARALAAQGTALRLARRPSEAREPLRRALELADACGAPGLMGHVRAELGAAGARPRTTAIRGAGALTPSERRAAAMAAEGMTNRAIAEALYVTPKTIELHLSSAYRKLGVRTRHELPGALGGA